MYVVATIVAGSLKQPWTERVFSDRVAANAELFRAVEAGVGGPRGTYPDLQVFGLVATNGPIEHEGS